MKVVGSHGGLTPFPFCCFSEALLNAVVFGVQGTAERALKGLWSDDRPQLTGLENDQRCWEVFFGGEMWVMRYDDSSGDDDDDDDDDGSRNCDDDLFHG